MTVRYSSTFLKISNVVWLCCLANFINSADRVIMPIAIIQMAEYFKWTLHEQGMILSAFSVGFLSSMVIGGSAAKKYGGKFVLSLSVILWSMSTLFTPIFANYFYITIFLRILLGVGEGLGLPTIFHIFSHVVSQDERSTAFGYLIALGSIGQTVSALACPHLPWSFMFNFFGLLGIVWVFVWVISYKEYRDPINGDEEEFVQPPKFIGHSVHWREFIRHWPLWAIYIAHFSMNWSNYIIMQWLPTYLSRYLGANETEIMYTAFPYISNSLLGIGSGYLADKLIRQHWSIISVRRLMTFIGLVIPGLFLLIFSSAYNVTLSVIYISLSMGFSACNSAGHLCNHAEVAPNHAGITFAISNTLATIPGILAGPLTAELVIKSGGRWFPVFTIAGVMNIVGAVIYVSQSSATQII
uniref:Slc17a-12 n=1 Tax=Schmidtea mediterranea TaxID=79327 RepID=A0A0H3YF25_SCHMD|nr:slc17a-12 [Schmidtea mediterranea]